MAGVDAILEPAGYSVSPAFPELAALMREEHDRRHERHWLDALHRTIDAIAGLTAVDGATIVTDRYDLLAFGAKIGRRDGWTRVQEIVVTELAGTALFGARFRENAARALLIPRRRPGQRTPLWQQRLKAQGLLQVARRYADFPVILETYRECLQDVFDLPALRTLLADLQARGLVVAQAAEAESDLDFTGSFSFAKN